jgi:pimeloyl-ACP methyl ester carboxylesterase
MPTTQVGTHTVYYDEHGAGHPLLLLSGLGSSRLGWWKQIEPLSQKYRVINMDNRDAGDSALGTRPYSITDLADDAAGVIKNLNLAPTFVMGISMGGFIALHLAVRHPALVEKLILVSTSAGGATQVNPAPEIAATLIRDPKQDLEAQIRHTYSLIAGPGYMQENPEDLDKIVEYAMAKPMSLESYQRQLGAVMSHRAGGVRDRLGEIHVPTLIIHGAADPLVPYPNGQALAADILNAKLSPYAGVGHLPPIEAPERFNREVMEFLG